MVHPMDPSGNNKIGGVETFVKNFIKYAPEDFAIEFVGISSDRRRAVGRWHKVELYGKRLDFFPTRYVKDENIRTTIPLSMKFIFSLLRHKKKISLENKILIFNRIESLLPFKSYSNFKLLTIHSSPMDFLYHPGSEVRWRNFPWLYFKLEERLISRVSKIFVVRRDAVEFYKKRYPERANRFSFLPTGVDEQLFYPFSPDRRRYEREKFVKQHNLTGENKLILFVGRLERQKDPLRLIDSFEWIYFREPKAALVVIGTGSFWGKMQEKVKQKGLEHGVKFLGHLAPEQVANIMRICDVFLLPSFFEGMPIVVLEALSCGIPVVATDVGEVKLVVKDGFSGRIVGHQIPHLGMGVLDILSRPEKFTRENCIKSVEPYRVQKILTPVYSYCYGIAASRAQ